MIGRPSASNLRIVPRFAGASNEYLCSAGETFMRKTGYEVSMGILERDFGSVIGSIEAPAGMFLRYSYGSIFGSSNDFLIAAFSILFLLTIELSEKGFSFPVSA